MLVDLNCVVEFLRDNDNYCILCHKNLDGDTLGGAYALFYGLYFNQCESKISFVKRYGDNTTDLYEMLKLIGVEKADGHIGRTGRLRICHYSVYGTGPYHQASVPGADHF